MLEGACGATVEMQEVGEGLGVSKFRVGVLSNTLLKCVYVKAGQPGLWGLMRKICLLGPGVV